MCNITVEYYKKNVKITLNDGKVVQGIYIEDFEEENEMLVGSTVIDKNNVKKIELI